MKTSLCRTIEKTILILLAIRPSLDLLTNMAGLGALKFNPASLLSLFLIAGGAIWIAAVDNETRKRALLAPLTLLLGAWIFLLAPWAFLPVIQHGTERIAGAREWIRLFSYLPIVIILSSLADRGQVKTILNYILISAIVPAIVGVYQIAFHQGAMIKDAHRIMGTFVHPNPFSFYIVLLIGLAYWQWRWTDRKASWTFAADRFVYSFVSDIQFHRRRDVRYSCSDLRHWREQDHPPYRIRGIIALYHRFLINLHRPSAHSRSSQRRPVG